MTIKLDFGDSMTESPCPTWAEATNVANAVRDVAMSCSAQPQTTAGAYSEIAVQNHTAKICVSADLFKRKMEMPSTTSMSPLKSLASLAV